MRKVYDLFMGSANITSQRREVSVNLLCIGQWYPTLTST